MTDEPSTVADRVAEHAVTVETDPEASPEDLDPLLTAFEDHTVVGLGEATHGTREFFELKHRLIAFLVRELDCRVVAMEAAFSESTAIYDYVVHGEGDPKEALDGIHFWTWNVESVLSLLEWLRAFNEGRPLDDRVRFYGVDAQHTVGPARELREYLDRVDPDYLARVEDDLDTLAEGLETWTTPDEEVLATTAATADTVAGVRDRLVERRESYVEATSPEEHELAVRHAWTLGRVHELAAENAAADDMSGWAVRERSMAANLAWALDREDADQVVLWAHNAHLMRGTRDLDGTQQRGLGQLLAATTATRSGSTSTAASSRRSPARSSRQRDCRRGSSTRSPTARLRWPTPSPTWTLRPQFWTSRPPARIPAWQGGSTGSTSVAISGRCFGTSDRPRSTCLPSASAGWPSSTRRRGRCRSTTRTTARTRRRTDASEDDESEDEAKD
jgi:erythromycin esterase-like protein